MAGFEHLLKSYDVGAEVDEIASSDPPAYLRRCFAEGVSAPALSIKRVQQLAVCGMVLDAVLNGRDYAALEPELMADWRAHYAASCGELRKSAVLALRRARGDGPVLDPDASGELEELERRLAPI